MNQNKYLSTCNSLKTHNIIQRVTNILQTRQGEAPMLLSCSSHTYTWCNLVLTTSYPLPLKYILPFRQICYDLCSTYVIPPTFTEVWKLVFQTVLQKLKHYTDDHTHPPVSNHQCLYKGGKKSVKCPQHTKNHYKNEYLHTRLSRTKHHLH